MEASTDKRVVPFAVYYDKADACFTSSKWLSFLVTAIAVGLGVAESVYKLSKSISTPIGYLNTTIIALFIFFEYRGSYLFRLAETERKLAFVDNTFNTRFAELDTQEYYTNDHVGSGMYKLAVNSMESCFTTSKNLAYMYPRVLTRNVVTALLIAFAGIAGNGDYARVFAESLVVANFTLELFRITIYSSKVSALLKEFYGLFQSLTSENITDLETAQIMKQILEYEATVAWANLPLDNSNFSRNRLQWAAEWKGIKARYNIR